VTTGKRLEQHDRQITSIRTLLHQGVRLLVDVQKAQKRGEQRIDRIERNLDLLVRSFRKGGNGHTKRKVDLQ
jgi:hypothetical protein